jgi:hypothetical protein
MPNLDIARLGALLVIEEKLRVQPKLKALYDSVLKELDEMAGALAPKPTPPPARVPITPEPDSPKLPFSIGGK